MRPPLREGWWGRLTCARGRKGGKAAHPRRQIFWGLGVGGNGGCCGLVGLARILLGFDVVVELIGGRRRREVWMSFD